MLLAPKPKMKQHNDEEKNEVSEEEKEETKELSFEDRNKQCENKKRSLIGRIEKWEKQNQE